MGLKTCYKCILRFHEVLKNREFTSTLLGFDQGLIH